MIRFRHTPPHMYTSIEVGSRPVTVLRPTGLNDLPLIDSALYLYYRNKVNHLSCPGHRNDAKLSGDKASLFLRSDLRAVFKILFGSQYHYQGTAFKLGALLHRCNVCRVVGNLFKYGMP